MSELNGNGYEITKDERNIGSARNFFKVDLKWILISVAWFCGLSEVTGWAAKAVYRPHDELNDGIIMFLMLLPFLAAGFLASVRTHPSGLFNSAVVGVLAGLLTVMFMSIKHSGGVLPSDGESANYLAGAIFGLIVCALGGALGAASAYFWGRFRQVPE